MAAARIRPQAVSRSGSHHPGVTSDAAYAVSPPSMAIAWPVMPSADSEHR